MKGRNFVTPITFIQKKCIVQHYNFTTRNPALAYRAVTHQTAQLMRNFNFLSISSQVQTH